MTERVLVHTAPACDWRIRGRLLERYAGEARPCVLGPPEAFSDTPAPVNPDWWFWPRIEPDQMGPKSRSVASRLNQSCCGWPKARTAPEFYEAVRAEEPTRRQRTVVYAFGLEADEVEVAQAWAEHAYTWRQLVHALHKTGFDVYTRIRAINQHAVVGHMHGIDLWTG